MRNAYDVLKERGFIAQCTHEDELREKLGREQVTFYMGYDPTADSLTAGHLLTLMAHAHLTRAGHRLITLMGTGTGMIGDPSDQSDMRKVMTPETVRHNIACFKEQFSRFVEYGDGKAIMESNDWLLDLKLVDFMREYGVHFTVNKMLAAECYKARLADGLTAFEFTYMLMQAYDFLHLRRRYGCTLQLGGSDQWGNIIAGVELCRRVDGAQVYGLTLGLLTTGDGSKMGKSAGNAVWLDAAKTSPYDFYQYWRNADDAQVVKLLKLLTFLDMEEISEMATWEGAKINEAKARLAYEVTKIVHGEAEADKARGGAQAAFGGGGETENIPTTSIPAGDFPMGILTLLVRLGLEKSNSDARRTVASGGVKINGVKFDSPAHIIEAADFLVQKGKKSFHRVQIA